MSDKDTPNPKNLFYFLLGYKLQLQAYEKNYKRKLCQSCVMN